MARLFITPREISFINDVSAEVIKDVVGQKIYYYSISAVKTQIDELYNEAPDKVFDNPIEINCLVLYKPEDVKTGIFGTDETHMIEVFIQPRDMLNKQIEIIEGDFFSFGVNFYEATAVITDKIIYGQIEYDSGIKIMGKKARKNQFISKVLGPTNEAYSDPDAVQKTFLQQRGSPMNADGPTGDVRSLQKNGVLEPALDLAEVSPKGTTSNAESSFYDE